MATKRWSWIGLVLGAGLAVAGCADGYGYGGLGGGYGVAGYGDPYGGGFYGAGYAPSYFGWQGDYYYPGSGVYVYDRWQRPHRWNSVQRGYWQNRARGWRGDRRPGRWDGFHGRGIGDRAGIADRPGYRPDRGPQGGWRGRVDGGGRAAVSPGMSRPGAGIRSASPGGGPRYGGRGGGERGGGRSRR